MTTTQKIARNAAIFATIGTAGVFYFVGDTFAWWGYLLVWIFAWNIWYKGSVKDAARENLANLNDR